MFVRRLMTCLVFIAALHSVPAVADLSTTVRFNIGPQSLSAALLKYSEQSRVQVTSPSELVDGRASGGVVGELAAGDALARLLEGTQLSYEVVDGNTVAIRGTKSRVGSNGAATADETPNLTLAEGASAIYAAAASGQTSDEKQNQPEPAAGGEKLEEIVVTAQKRVERLQDVPVPVTTISAQALTNSNQLRVQDYYNKIPGLGLALEGNGSEPVITIRGITTGGNTNPTVGIVVDEVSYGSSAATGEQTPAVVDIDPGDLARVEVLRGPQGTLYGASSIGGLLKFVTLDPSIDKLSGRLQVGSTGVSHSDDYGYSVRGNVNVPLSDSVAVRASAFTLRDPGFVDNNETGNRDVNGRDSEGGRLSLLWRPAEDFSLKVSALMQDSERRGTQDVDSQLGSDPRQAFLAGTGLYRRKTEAYAATLVGKLGRVELTSASGYSTDILTDSLDITTLLDGLFADAAGDIFQVDRAVSLIHNNVEKFTQEVRISVPLGDRLNWLLGTFYTKEETSRNNDNRAASSTGEIFGTLLSTGYDPSTFKEYAAFTNLTFDVTDRWDIQVGGRISDNKQSYPTILRGPMLLAFGFPTDEVTLSAANEIKDTAFTYLVTPRFRVSDDLMVYARAASGYRPGGPNASCGLPGIPCKFEADTTQNYDVGVKGNIGGDAFSFDGSLYYIDWKDIQIPGILEGISSYTGNVSRAKSQGVELSVQVRPYKGTVLSAWAAYNDAQLTEPFPPGSLVGNTGDRLPYSSRFSGSVAIDQDFAVSGAATAFLGGTLSYVGDRKGNFQPSTTRQNYPAYAQIDLRSGVRYDTWTLNLFANNVTDKRGVLRGGLDAEFISSYFTYIQPRTVGLSLAKSFD